MLLLLLLLLFCCYCYIYIVLVVFKAYIHGCNLKVQDLDFYTAMTISAQFVVISLKVCSY